MTLVYSVQVYHAPLGQRGLWCCRSLACSWINARLFQRARKLNSRSVAVRNAYVQFYLRPLGRIEQALREIAEALDSDPLSPLLRWLNAYMLYFQRDYDGALKWCSRTREMEPNQYLSHLLEGMVYEGKQMLPDFYLGI